MRLVPAILALPLVFLTQTSAVRTDLAAAPTPVGVESAGEERPPWSEVVQLIAVLDDERAPRGRRAQAARELGQARAPEAIPVLLKHILLQEYVPPPRDPSNEDLWGYHVPPGPCSKALLCYGHGVFEPVVRAYLAAGRRRETRVAFHVMQVTFEEQDHLLDLLRAADKTRSKVNVWYFVLQFGKAVTDPADQRELFRLFNDIDENNSHHAMPSEWPKLGN